MLHSMWISPPGEPSCRSCLALQNDRKNTVILSEAKDPGRRTAGYRSMFSLRTGFFVVTLLRMTVQVSS